MASMVAQSAVYTASGIIGPGGAMDNKLQNSQGQRTVKSEPDEKSRGRHRSRTQNRPKDSNEYGSGGDVDDGQSSGPEGPDGPSRKRRRSRKGLDKKFECPQEGCGKSYSRAEHLYVTTMQYCCILFVPVMERC